MDEFSDVQPRLIPDASSNMDDRKQELESAQHQLRAERQRLAQVLEFVSEACLVTDDLGVIQQANAAAATLFRMPKTRLIGLRLIQFVTPKARSVFPNHLTYSVPAPMVRIYEAALQPDGGQPFLGVLRVTALASAGGGHPNFLWFARPKAAGEPTALQSPTFSEDAVHALQEIVLEFNPRLSLRPRLKTIADRLKALFQAQSIVIFLFDPARGELELEIAKGLATIPGTHVRMGEGVIGIVAQDRQPMLMDSYEGWPFREPQVEEQPISAVVVPMLCFDDVVGVMAIARIDKAPVEFNWDDVRLLQIFGTLAALVVHVARTNDTLKQERERRKRAEHEFKVAVQKVRTLSAKVEAIREEERIQLSRQIHDELGQLLTGFKLDLDWLARNQQALLEKSQSLLKLSDSTIASVQRISTELRPGVLDELGLAGALEWQAQDFETRYGIECVVNLETDARAVDRNLATAVFRILQEALTNVARHAHATRISIELREARGHLVLEIQDNGCGIQESQATSPKSLGLVGMRERAASFGGKVEVTGAPGQGTTVIARFPPQKSAASEEMSR